MSISKLVFEWQPKNQGVYGHFARKFLSNLTLAGIYQKKMFELYALLTVKYPVKLVAMASNVSSCTLDIFWIVCKLIFDSIIGVRNKASSTCYTKQKLCRNFNLFEFAFTYKEFRRKYTTMLTFPLTEIRWENKKKQSRKILIIATNSRFEILLIWSS